MKIHLIDVNVLVALFDESHEHHELCLNWCKKIGFQIAICPIVENGLLRICSHPKYPNNPSSFHEIMNFLLDLRVSTNSKFISDSYFFSKSLSSKLKFDIPSKHITDAYLLQLAVQEGMLFSTLDRKIPKEILAINKTSILNLLSN